MEFSTHYLLMADHAMLQKLVMSRIKPLGLTTGQPKVLDFLQDHDSRKPPYGVCPPDRPRPGAVPPLE
mgnify:CR=1 FL=1